jgi:hypothetical protein
MRQSVIRRLIPSCAAILWLALPATSTAQPSVSTVSGQWLHKGTVTIGGSGFGSKGTAAPVVWDDASGASITDKWTGAWPNNNPTYNTIYRAPQRGINLPHNHITRYIAGAHGEGLGANFGYAVMFFKTRSFSAYPYYSYLSWYQRADDAWVFGDDNNFKTFAFSVGTTPYEMPNNWYLAYNTPLPNSRTSGASYIFGDDSNGIALHFPDANGHNQWWDGAVNPMSGVWTKIEMEVKYTNQNDGYVKLWENGAIRVNYVGHTDGLQGNTRTEGIGGYGRMYNQPNNWRYFADAYLDYSRARVILGNASTLANSTIREVQIPTSWSSSSVSVSANLGKFSNGQTVYLYVVDPNGTVNPQGYPVSLGTTTPDTTPPTVAVSAPVNGATNVAATATVRATFDEGMNASTITAANFELRDPSSALVAGTITYDAGTRVATFAPASMLGNSKTYTATIKGGTSGVKDAAGNALAANYAWSFTTAATTPPPPTGGAVLKLGFDEGSGTIANDTSGSNNDGMLSGTTWTTGRFGGGLSFNGIDAWVTIPHAASLDLSAGMTIEAWLKPTALSGWSTAVIKETADGLAYSLYANDDNPWPAAYVRRNGASTSDATAGTAPLALNAWTHLAATHNGTTLQLFVNGVAVSSMPASGSIVASTGSLRIGGNQVWGEYFTGVIDEVRVYSRALSQSEILADMSSSVGGTGDTTPPTVSAVSPAGTAPIVGLNAKATGTFSEPMQAATVNGTNFELRVVASGALVASTVSYDTSTNVATLTPNSPLTTETQYRATVKAGATGVKDVAGNAMTANYSWTFTAAAAPSAPTNLRIVR